MQFVDQVHIHVRGGSGGKGAVAFRREKFVPKGGPAGGDGGNGGSVILTVDSGLSTLLDFRYKNEYFAPAGESGGNKDRYGHAGADLILRVPPGTQVFEAQGQGGGQGDAEGTSREKLLADLRLPGESFVAAPGGRGGRGNIHFATSTDRAPRKSEPGLPGEERRLRLDLKLLADVGLLGFPNVGKSSLIARISAARPKIADYPFTTLIPNLGMVRLSGERSFVVADVPGLIEGAHRGAGLGDRFLRHLERTRVLVHLLEVSTTPGRTPLGDFQALSRELELYDLKLAARPQIVVLNKIDMPEVKSRLAQLARPFKARGIPLLGISAATGEGLAPLLEEIWKQLARAAAAAGAQQDAPAPAGSVRSSAWELAFHEAAERAAAPAPARASPRTKKAAARAGTARATTTRSASIARPKVRKKSGKQPSRKDGPRKQATRKKS